MIERARTVATVTAPPSSRQTAAQAPWLTGLRIVANVVVYRVRKLEMANLAAVGSIAVALQLPPLDIAARCAFAFLLNVLVYLHNDYVDVELDIASAGRDAGNARYLAQNRSAALYAQGLLLGMLAAAALSYDPSLLVPLSASSVICVWYSAQLKHMPGWDIVATTLGGAAMTLCGTPVTSSLGWLMALQLGLFSGVFEAIQVLRDAAADAESGLRTTGVALGVRRGLWLARALMLVASASCALLLQPWAAALSVLALGVRFTPHAVARYWTRVKLVYGCTWLSVCVWVFVTGRGGGLLR